MARALPLGGRATGLRAAVAPSSHWDPLIIVLAGVILQYVWRVQAVFPALAKIQFTAVVSLGAVLLFFTDRHPRRRIAHAGHVLFRWVLAILGLAILSAPTSLRVGASVQFLTDNFVKTVVLVGVLVAAVRDRRDVDRLLRVFVLGGAAYVVASLAFASAGAGRLGGMGGYDPNDLGLFAVSTLPLCIYLMRRGARWVERLSGLVAATMLLIGNVDSGSRGAFLALVAVALYGLLALSVVRRSKRLTIAAVAVGLMAGVASDAYWERIHTILTPQEDYNWAGESEAGRMEIWKRGLGYMAQRPLFGVGVDQFPVAEGTLSPQAARQEMGIGLKWSSAHSVYVQIGAELGVLGLAAFLTLLGLAFREARRIGRTAATPGDRLLGQAFGGLVVAYAVGGAFLSQAYGGYLYFALGLLIGFSRVVARETAPVPLVADASRHNVRNGGAVHLAAVGRRRPAR